MMMKSKLWKHGSRYKKNIQFHDQFHYNLNMWYPQDKSWCAKPVKGTKLHLSACWHWTSEAQRYFGGPWPPLNTHYLAEKEARQAEESLWHAFACFSSLEEVKISLLKAEFKAKTMKRGAEWNVGTAVLKGRWEMRDPSVWLWCDFKRPCLKRQALMLAW